MLVCKIASAQEYPILKASLEFQVKARQVHAALSATSVADRAVPDCPHPEIGIGQTEQNLADLGEIKQTLATIGQS